MSDGGGGALPPPATNGGEFLLSLLHKQQQHQQRQTPPQQQSPTVDPAVAAVGPPLPFAPPPWSYNSNGPDLPFPLPPWPHSLSPPQPFPPNFLGFPQNPFPPPRNQFSGNQIPPNHSLFGDDPRRVGFPGIDARSNSRIDKFTVQQTHQEPKIKFGSFASEIRSPEVLSNVISHNSLDTTKFTAPKEGEAGLGNRSYNGLDRNWQFEPRVNSNSNSNPNSNAFRRANYDSREQERRGGDKYHSENYRSSPPPGFPSKLRGKGNWDSGNRRRGLEHNVDKQKANYLEFGSSYISSDAEDERLTRLSMEGEKSSELRLSRQLDRPGLTAGSNLPSVSGLDIEESISNLHSEIVEFGDGNSFQGRDKFKEDGSNELDDIGEQLVDSLLLENESDGKNGARKHRTSREKVDYFYCFCFFLFLYDVFNRLKIFGIYK
jgi:hypothetical protein